MSYKPKELDAIFDLTESIQILIVSFLKRGWTAKRINAMIDSWVKNAKQSVKAYK